MDHGLMFDEVFYLLMYLVPDDALCGIDRVHEAVGIYSSNECAWAAAKTHANHHGLKFDELDYDVTEFLIDHTYM